MVETAWLMFTQAMRLCMPLRLNQIETHLEITRAIRSGFIKHH